LFGVVPSTCISVLFFLHMSLSFHPTRLCSTISHPMPVSPSYPFFFSRLPLLIIFSASCPLQMFISSVAFIHTPLRLSTLHYPTCLHMNNLLPPPHYFHHHDVILPFFNIIPPICNQLITQFPNFLITFLSVTPSSQG